VSHTYAQTVIHVVFSTKDRRKLILNEFRPRMWAYATGICNNLGILVHAVGGMEDHIHLLLQVPPTLALAKAVLAIKSNSSRWANEEGHNSHGSRDTERSA
jgi:REP-associated tyrosine transposase